MPYLILLPALLLWGCWLVLRRPDQRPLIAYLCAHILYIAILGIAFEIVETQRFRFMTDPFYVVLLGLALQACMRARRMNMRPTGLSGG